MGSIWPNVFVRTATGRQHRFRISAKRRDDERTPLTGPDSKLGCRTAADIRNTFRGQVREQQAVAGWLMEETGRAVTSGRENT